MLRYFDWLAMRDIPVWVWLLATLGSAAVFGLGLGALLSLGIS